ncbi:hypothetical protein C2845_PM17G03650 [Panicum miliaceum]|uniref:Uncharacterized protein n=1 Tax=Panicum miliaceum TaxID=4540 RepID=A0A3L6Q2R4_PANMI|nr:hypothetical protein C2845_PM17G03650 [Panicum miliaceum]
MARRLLASLLAASLLLPLARLDSSVPAAAATTAYDELRLLGFPRGLLPANVRGVHARRRVRGLRRRPPLQLPHCVVRGELPRPAVSSSMEGWVLPSSVGAARTPPRSWGNAPAQSTQG